MKNKKIIFVLICISVISLLCCIPGIGLIVFFEPVSIKGYSMEPNYKNNQNYLINKLVYKFSEPKRGDVIVYNTEGNLRYIHRIIGLPGDKVEIQEGKLYLNDSILDEPYIENDTYTNENSFLKERQGKQVPIDYYFVLGDNRTNSLDSRITGFISAKKIIGKVSMCYKNCSAD